MSGRVLRKRLFQLRPFLFFMGITLGACVFSWLLGGLWRAQELSRPPLMICTDSWLSLQTMVSVFMGLAAYLVWRADDIDSGRVLRLYLALLTGQTLWMLFLWRLEWRLFAFFWSLLLLGLFSIILTGYRCINRWAYRLMLPALFFGIFGAYINLGYYLFNRK